VGVNFGGGHREKETPSKTSTSRFYSGWTNSKNTAGRMAMVGIRALLRKPLAGHAQEATESFLSKDCVRGSYAVSKN